MQKVKSRSELKRDQILKAAGCQFITEGFSATSMEAVAKEAEVSKQTVYSHFGSKEELFRSAIADRCAQLGFHELLAENLGPSKQTLTQLAIAFYTLITSPDALSIHRICVSESIKYPNLAKLFYSAAPAFIINEIAKCLAEYDRRGELCIKNPHEAAVQFLALVKGEQWNQLELNMQPSLNEEDTEQYIINSVALFLRGYSC